MSAPDAEPGQSHLTLEGLAELLQVVQGLRRDAGLPWEGYDVAIEGDSTGEFVKSDGTPAEWEQVGATWWIESWWTIEPGVKGLTELRRRIEAGPPR